MFSQPVVNGAAPAARCAHSSTLWDDKFIVFGGGDGNRRFKDVYVLSVSLVIQYQSEALQKTKKAQRRARAPSVNSALDVATVLGNAGLRKYAEAFLEQEITVEMFPLLKEEHLVQLGMNTIGARLQFASYLQSPPSPASPAESSATQQITALSSEMQSLRTSLRHLTEAVVDLSRSRLLLPHPHRPVYPSPVDTNQSWGAHTRVTSPPHMGTPSSIHSPGVSFPPNQDPAAHLLLRKSGDHNYETASAERS